MPKIHCTLTITATLYLLLGVCPLFGIISWNRIQSMQHTGACLVFVAWANSSLKRQTSSNSVCRHFRCLFEGPTLSILFTTGEKIGKRPESWEVSGLMCFSSHRISQVRLRFQKHFEPFAFNLDFLSLGGITLG